MTRSNSEIGIIVTSTAQWNQLQGVRERDSSAAGLSDASAQGPCDEMTWVRHRVHPRAVNSWGGQGHYSGTPSAWNARLSRALNASKAGGGEILEIVTGQMTFRNRSAVKADRYRDLILWNVVTPRQVVRYGQWPRKSGGLISELRVEVAFVANVVDGTE